MVDEGTRGRGDVGEVAGVGWEGEGGDGHGMSVRLVSCGSGQSRGGIQCIFNRGPARVR